MPRTLLIMPAWNEEEVIAGTIAEVKAVLPDMDLLVVNDGSTDGTVRVAEAAGARVLSLPFNLGVGGAMRAGYTYAARFGYERAIQLDADGQHDPRNVPKVLAGLENANISIGSRFAGSGDYEVRGPRKWAMQVLSRIVSSLARTRLTDITSGFRAADRVAITQYVKHYPVEYLGDTIDSLVVAIRSGLTVTQVPVEMRPRQAGTPSNNPFKAALYLVRSMFALFVALTRRPVRRARPGAKA
ncbi:glycosyltransferase family 2 protein [Brooklawnia cerclae]|uniref:Glycosyltransferase involved in cell wall biosynthesis n=1 Tax=Brooklawnia cerclae TaxID=349934 RepID=A0ABX0SI39_9ACTN|nr:glycosyltransferase family 2 protein [Brooklawnia cerclae]NIH58067.1 glycosyltransferase involved in cell wall biosynthesis [Brooklawnia cerclae]